MWAWLGKGASRHVPRYRICSSLGRSTLERDLGCSHWPGTPQPTPASLRRLEILSPKYGDAGSRSSFEPGPQYSRVVWISAKSDRWSELTDRCFEPDAAIPCVSSSVEDRRVLCLGFYHSIRSNPWKTIRRTMTMEDRSGGMERAAPATVNNVTSSSPSDASYPLPRSVKRSFDVAFLVAPDENLARRQNEKLRLVSTEKLTEKRSHVVREINVTTDHEADRMPQNLTIKHFDQERKILQTQISPPYISPRLHVASSPKASPEATEPVRRYGLSQIHKTPSPPIFLNHTVNKNLASGDPTAKGYDTIPSPDKNEMRSAFTKVAFVGQKNGYDSSQVSPRSSVSPDQLSYQSSISPPVNLTNQPAYKYAPFPGKVAYPFLMNHETQQNSILENLKMPQPPKDFSNQLPSPKVTGFRPELSPVYPNLPYNPISVFPPMAEALARPRFLATAAGVTGLLPPSFAALTLPAQNVCAKCNLSFRMTSDLVYHMRSHHKSENAGEAARRRREEKLRCPVCDESFRERHHLTRHMTAHQDKESDAIVDQVEIKRRATAVHGK